MRKEYEVTSVIHGVKYIHCSGYELGEAIKLAKEVLELYGEQLKELHLNEKGRV